MLFFGKAHAATTNLPVTETMSLWDRIQPPVDISANGHLITDLFSYTTYMVIFFFYPCLPRLIWVQLLLL